MSFELYKRRKNEVLECLENVKSNISNKKIKDQIDEKINTLKDDRFIISVFGHFSVGKSSFLNALMGFGEEIVKEAVESSTATIIRLRSPEDDAMINKVKLIFNDGNIEIIDIKDLSTYTSKNKSFNVEENIKEAIVYIKSKYLENGVEIVDTPGFNSTNISHTEIAQNHVPNSDACIFLFSYDKVGSDVEFKFLEYINQYMDRVFFVINKIDMCDNTQESVEDTKNDLIGKMDKRNIDYQGKLFYPISSKLAKEGIKENSDGKMESSRFIEFTNSLSNYLTSEENIKDRLQQPLNFAIKLLEDEKVAIKDSIDNCNKDSEDIANEINKRKRKIEELEKELKEKNRNIKKRVQDEIRQAKRKTEVKVSKIVDDVSEELKIFNDSFSIRLVDFKSIATSTYDKFLKSWSYTVEDLESNLIDLLGENIDSDEDFSKLEKKIRKHINSNLNIERVDIDDPKLDFSQINDLNKEIEKARNEWENIREKMSQIHRSKEEKENLLAQKEDIENEIKRMRNEKEHKIDNLSGAKLHRGVRQKQEKIAKGGPLGKIGDMLFGQKVVYKTEEFVDRSEVEYAEKKMKEIEEKFSIKIDEKKKDISKLIDNLVSIGNIDQELEYIAFEEEISRERYRNTIESIEEEKYKIKNSIVKFSKENYLKSLQNSCETYTQISKKFLDDKKDIISLVLNEALEIERDKINHLKNGLDKITTLSNKTPLELENDIKSFYEEIESINKNIEYLNEIKMGR